MVEGLNHRKHSNPEMTWGRGTGLPEMTQRRGGSAQAGGRSGAAGYSRWPHQTAARTQRAAHQGPGPSQGYQPDVAKLQAQEVGLRQEACTPSRQSEGPRKR